MYILAMKYTGHHHPVHSLIINPKDDIWNPYFTPKQIKELKSYKAPQLPVLSRDMTEYLLSYRGKCDMASLSATRQARIFDPYAQSDLYWAQKSIIDVLDLFIYKLLPDNEDTESDLINRKWSFVEKLFDTSRFSVRGGEKASLSSSIRKNENRAINDRGQLERKLIGTKVDLSFTHLSLEYGCAEAGCSSDPYNTKALNEGRLKLPRTLKDILARLSKESPSKLHEIKVPGLIISGLTVTLCIADCPAGSVTRITTVGPYDFPDNVEQFSKKIIPLIALAWQTRVILERTLDMVNDDDKIIFPTVEGPAPAPIPPCMPSPKRGSKRKATQSDTDYCLYVLFISAFPPSPLFVHCA